MFSKGIGLDEVKRAYKKEKNPKLRKRIRMIMGLMEGLSTIKVAEKMTVSQPNVIYWKKRFEREGLAGLQDRPRPGRPPKVERRMMERIRKEVKAKRLNKATDVRNLIYKRTGVRYSLMHVMRILHSWGLSRKYS